ncbi:MAG: hypothetical protein J6P31_02320 [Oscillospiraceae bacterium]|nr:hypothetical protein [Oscillospiraceae bacterium]
MKNLRRNFERFCYRNRNKGIPNLMLWIAAGNVIVYILSLIDPSNTVLFAITFNPSLILKGQVWRLISYILIPDSSSFVLFFVIMLIFYVQIGRIMESVWGRLRFTLFYFCGVLIMDIAGLVLNCAVSVSFLNVSLILSYATLAPENQVLLFGIIPLKMKWLAWGYLGLTVFQVLVYGFPAKLLPIFALANYLLFFGSAVKNVLPSFRGSGQIRIKRPAGSSPDPNWANRYRRPEEQKKPYRHKCTVCGRTDTECPGLEFRYCSRCNGYYCYCMDHINNHEHIL